MSNRVELIEASVKGKVLDVGYNVSTLHWELKKKFDVVGIDIYIKKPEKNVLKADAQALPFKQQSFDSVLAGELIEHLEKPESFIQESSRVLKKGGVIIITTPNVKSLVNRVSKSYHAPAHISLFSKSELEALLEKYKLRIKMYTLFPYTAESSEGSKHKWFFLFRKLAHYALPKSLQEEIFVVAEKI